MKKIQWMKISDPMAYLDDDACIGNKGRGNMGAW
jgi:hypothetical protein